MLYPSWPNPFGPKTCGPKRIELWGEWTLPALKYSATSHARSTSIITSQSTTTVRWRLTCCDLCGWSRTCRIRICRIRSRCSCFRSSCSNTPPLSNANCTPGDRKGSDAVGCCFGLGGVEILFQVVQRKKSKCFLKQGSLNSAREDILSITKKIIYSRNIFWQNVTYPETTTLRKMSGPGPVVFMWPSDSKVWRPLF